MIRGIQRAIPGVLLVLLAESDLAQVVRGRITARESGAAVDGAVVRLLDESGRDASGTLSGANGEYLLRAPAPGTYRIRVDRIGFGGEFSPLLTLRRGEAIDHSLSIIARPISLEGVRVNARSRGCEVPDRTGTIARVWEEARKALQAVDITQSSQRVSFDTETFRRELEPASGEVRWETRRSGFATSGTPFRSLPVEELREKGYVRSFPDSTVYFAPDAAVLLSDAFLQDHCFGLRGGGTADRLIGLEFRPLRRPTRPDIEGVLWLDRRTAELEAVDYGYVGTELPLSTDSPGGRIEFDRVPGRGWIVDRWTIRMPQFRKVVSRWRSPGSGQVEERSTIVVAGLIEEGGEVVAVREAPSTAARGGDLAIQGIVIDSLAGRPLAGAHVYLSGTNRADTTDAAGRFRIGGLAPGRYLLSFTHPHLAPLGIHPPPRPLELGLHDVAELSIATPSSETILRSTCPEVSTEEGLLVGRVRTRSGGRPVSGAHVQVRWTAESRLRGETLIGPGAARTGEVTLGGAEFDVMRREIQVSSDGAGRFRVCGIPTGRTIEIRVEAKGHATPPPVRIQGATLVARDLVLPGRRETSN